MVIFHSYLSLPERSCHVNFTAHHWDWRTILARTGRCNGLILGTWPQLATELGLPGMMAKHSRKDGICHGVSTNNIYIYNVLLYIVYYTLYIVHYIINGTFINIIWKSYDIIHITHYILHTTYHIYHIIYYILVLFWWWLSLLHILWKEHMYYIYYESNTIYQIMWIIFYVLYYIINIWLYDTCWDIYIYIYISSIIY